MLLSHSWDLSILVDDVSCEYPITSFFLCEEFPPLFVVNLGGCLESFHIFE